MKCVNNESLMKLLLRDLPCKTTVASLMQILFLNKNAFAMDMQHYYRLLFINIPLVWNWGSLVMFFGLGARTALVQK
jgi:hypothetical protein